MLNRVPSTLPSDIEDVMNKIIGDLVVESCVVVEVKAVSQLEEIHGAQLVSYLKATGLRAGLLMNFNKPVLKAGLRRIVV